MGVFKKFFQTKASSESDLNRRSSSSPNHSTSTSSNNPPIQPLWALATEPELSPNKYSHYTHTGVGSDGRRRHFGPRDPRPSSLQQPHYEQQLSHRVQQLGLYDPRNPSQWPQREERPPAPPQSTRTLVHPQSHSYSHRPTNLPLKPSHSSSNPFPSYPPYPSPSQPNTYCDKPLPPTSHSPDRPRPQPQSRSTPPSNSPRRPLPSPTPIHSPAKSAPSSIPHRQQSKASPRRKRPPPAVVIEISSSSSSSSTAEFTDYEEDGGEGGGDSSIEFMTTPSSSPSTSRRTRTPSPVKSNRLETPPSITMPSTKNGSRSSSPAKKKEKEKKTPTSVSPSKHSSPSKSTLSTPTTRLDTPRKMTTSQTPSPSPSPSPSRPRSKTSTPKVQCHGLTSSGKQCTRFATPTLSPSMGRPEDKEEEDADEEEGGEPVFCHQHTKTSLVQTGCFVRSAVLSNRVGEEEESRSRGKTGRSREVWINYNDWILPDLPLQTQSLLRHYLKKPVSDKDREGYIYIHELIDKNSPPTTSSPTSTSSELTYLKLGRTIHPILRLTQWRSSCPSLDPIVRDILPRKQQQQQGPFQARSDPQYNIAEIGTRNHFRWERLCLVEIAGRCELLYTNSTEEEETTSTREKEKCRDCGKKHFECFRVGRDAFGESGWVVEIVERWERWCRDVLG